MERTNKTKEKMDITELAINIKGAIEFSMIIAFTTGMICMVACDKKNAKNQTPEPVIVETKQASNLDIITGNVEEGSVKTFDVGQHVVSARVYYDNNRDNIEYAVNNIPDGYEVFDVEPLTAARGSGSTTVGFDIWFKNTKPVKVTSSYSEIFNNYGYYTFGEVIEKEKVLEK